MSTVQADFCYEAGAMKAALTIREYWTKRGLAVNLVLVESAFVAAMRSTRFDIRSDLINGYPVARLADGHAPRPVTIERR